MRWRVRPLGCLLAVAIFAVVGVAVVALVLAGGIIGNGGGPLRASGVQAGTGMEDVPDRPSGGSVGPVPTWRVTGNRDVTFSLRLRNAGEDAVTVEGVRRDPDGDDQQFRPERLEGAPVTLRPGEERTVTVSGRSAACGSEYGGQITGKNGQTFAYGGGETQNVDFDALIEFVCR